MTDGARRHYRPNPNRLTCKLNPDMVRELRRRYAAGDSMLDMYESCKHTGISYLGMKYAIYGRFGKYDYRVWDWLEDDPNWRVKLMDQRAAVLRARLAEREATFEALRRAKAAHYTGKRLAWQAATQIRKQAKYMRGQWPPALLQLLLVCRTKPGRITLQELGDIAQVTRERIRQLEKFARERYGVVDADK